MQRRIQGLITINLWLSHWMVALAMLIPVIMKIGLRFYNEINKVLFYMLTNYYSGSNISE
jgi:hypothetical protein